MKAAAVADLDGGCPDCFAGCPLCTSCECCCDCVDCYEYRQNELDGPAIATVNARSEYL